MPFQHPDDIWPGGDSITDTCGAASVAIGLPTLDAGDSGAPGGTDIPKRVAITTDASGGVYFKIGLSGLSVSAHGDGSDGVCIYKAHGTMVVVTAGNTHIAHFGTVAAELITITPLND